VKPFLIVLFASLFACFETKPPPPPPVLQIKVGDPMSYLVEEADNAGRHDWPPPQGYVALTNAAEGRTRARQTWDFAPFGAYEPERGDGFQIAEFGADGYVRFTSTRDGGTPYVQHFVGRRCGGSGWIVFGQDAPTGDWREVVATLNIAKDPATCPPSLNYAFTRYRLEQVDFPFAMKGSRSTRMISTVISEHYDHKTIAQSRAMERSYLGQGYGLLRWEAWTRRPPSIPDLPERCGPVAYSVAPEPGWQLADCRTYTNIVAQ